MRTARSQSSVRGQRRKQRRTTVLVLLIGGAASLLLTGCASDRDEGVAAFPPAEQTTSLEEAWVASVGTLLDQRDAGLENAWRTRLDSATDLTRSGAPYVFEQIVPEA
jgi:hypothetical protein